MLRTLGADLVGMSTALEAIAARAAGRGGLRPLAGHQRRRRHHRREARPPTRSSPRARPRPAGWASSWSSSSGAWHERHGAAHRRGRPDRHLAARRAARARLGGALPRRRPGARRAAGRGAGRRRRHRPGRRWSTPPRASTPSCTWPASSGESTWPAISHANIEGTYCALEAARRAGVQRVVLASSNHATGYTPAPGRGLLHRGRRAAAPRHVLRRREGDDGGARLAVRRPLRHGRRLPADRQRASPSRRRCGMLATWLSPADTVSLVDAALTAPRPGLRRRLGRLGQHAELVGPHRRPRAGLRAGRRRRGLRRGADRGSSASPTRPIRCTPAWAASTRCPSSTPRTSRLPEAGCERGRCSRSRAPGPTTTRTRATAPRSRR